MTYPVTLYRWDDPGAPQITTPYGSANEVKAVLDACLVNGYGAKAPLGWSKVFDDSNGVVYQNNVAAGGSGGMVRFWPKSGNWNVGTTDFASAMTLQSAKSYVASNTPVRPSGPWAFYHPVNTTAVKAWVLIGTAIGFYLFFHWYDGSKTSATSSYKMSNTAFSASCYVGDILSLLAGDAYKFVTVGYDQVNSMTINYISNQFTLCNSGSMSNNGNTVGIVFYDSDGGSGTTLYQLKLPFGDYGTAIPSAGYADPVLVCPVALLNNNFSSANSDQAAKQPYCRGFMPGMVNSLFGDGGVTTYWPYTKHISGVNHWLIGMYGSSTISSNKWINLVEW